MQMTDIGPKEVRIPGPIVEERPLYRFDGQPAQRSFVADLFDASGVGASPNRPPDDDAVRYLTPFLANDLAAVFANVTKANVASLNPPVRSQVPASLLPQFGRPLWDSVSNGQLESAMAVTVPRVTAASGLAGEHAEGADPADGSMTVTAADSATPKPVSGQVTLNRELIDFAAPALTDQVAFALMQAAWSEVVEARIAALLDGLTVTTVGLVGTNAALDDDWQDLLIPLQATAGGQALTSLVLADELYGPSRRAKDGTAGRRIYRVGPGGVLDVDGIGGVPAWALAVANGGAGNSYLFNRASVHAAEMVQRFRLNAFSVAKVVLAIWGFSAEWCTRPADVRRLTYAAA
ncbi:hypothetical protein M3G91_32705 [Micromonospora chalcea]|uniref:hypothetical protein n=1 Tax=Micromonospora chalcea TaxID=1874 RepID=UPI0021A94743|nr:hypothetical protein [Micromonospora chalcea]MCT2282369.1 hypothetical protein [Micromonospora chalcea]